MPALETQRAVEQFLYRQAECLDGKRWQDFIDLFAADGVYWMPAHPDQLTGDGEPSIFYEDRAMMTIRMKRMQHPRAWSQKTAWNTSHVVSNVIIESEDARSGGIVCRSRFYMMEFRRDAVRAFAGSYRHDLVKGADDYRIRLQRIDMVNGDAPYEYVLQAWV
jgi:3-phenylpropionate/cinnamic acid dioxygenase small subunit